MTADTSRSALDDRTGRAPGGDLVALHTREADRLLAYLCSSDRSLGLAEAEAVCQQAFMEVRNSWPGIGPYSRPEVYVFAAAQRTAAARPSSSSSGDALTESAPDYWDRADVARLTVLQDSLDKLSLVPRRAVVLREMCGFTPLETAEVLGLPEPAVESARGDALRTLVPMIESGTSGGQARRGPLSPEDFAALGRVLQHTDPRHIEDRQRFAAALAQPRAMNQPSFQQTQVLAPQPQAAPVAQPMQPQPMQPQPMQPQPMQQPAFVQQQPMQQPAFVQQQPMQQPAFVQQQPMQQPAFVQQAPGSQPVQQFPAPPPAAPYTAVFSPQAAQPMPAFGAGAQQMQPQQMQPQQMQPQQMPPAPPTSVLGGPTPGGEVLFAAGPAVGPVSGPSAPAGWMGGFGVRRPTAPPTVSAPSPMTGMPMTGGLPLGGPGLNYNGASPGGGPSNGASSNGVVNGGANGGSYNGSASNGSGSFNGSGSYTGAGSYNGGGTYNGGTYGTPASGAPGYMTPTGMRLGMTPLDGPSSSFGDPGLNVGTPIFDSVSAWFSSPSGGPNGRGDATNHWASLQDRGWREASARAAATPLVAGSTSTGLPVRAPGANMVPSAADAAVGMMRPFSREVPRPDPGRVRNRLDSFQQGVQTARQLRDQLWDDAASDRVPEPAPEPAPAREPAPPVPVAAPPVPAAPSGGGSAGRARDGGPVSGGLPVATVTPEVADQGRRGREGGFGAFYRDYLPDLLALLMIEGARPTAAAQVAQDSMSEAYREWAQLENPREWTRQVALSAWAAQRRSADGDVPASGSGRSGSNGRSGGMNGSSGR